MRLTVTLSAVLLATLSACADSPTAPATGSFSVTIEGLPVGELPSVRVSGPGMADFPIGLSGTGTKTLGPIRNGTYTIVASAVTTPGGTRYMPTPATQTVVVRGGTTTTASNITYAIATSRLAVTVLGLPSGVRANVVVSGPNGFAFTITGNGTLQLPPVEPGSYTITANQLQTGGKTYRAAVAPRQLTLAPSTTFANATVAYGAGLGLLDLAVSGLPTGTDASVTVTGPGGYSRTLTSSTTLEYLEAGTYTVAPGTVASSLVLHRPVTASQTITVADGGTSTVAVAYGSTPLALAVQLVVEGLTQPVFVGAPDGDPRLFIVERPGRIRLFANGALVATPFLDIRARVNNNGERGMLGMAFDPRYAENGYFYVYYVDLAGNVVVERFASTPGQDVAGGSAGIAISIPHGGPNHHGGMIAFGPDGMLYLAPGDGGCCGDPQNHAQNMNILLGKVLRIDVSSLPYTIPAGNPFFGQAPARAEIWAAGLRNPWRFSFDAPAELLYIGDVGQDAREEVNVVRTTAAGLNYGWRNMEGTACYNPATSCNPSGRFTLPALEYLHTEGCSITGGYVYRGSAMPELTGHYLYSDYCRGWLRSFRFASGAATEQRSWAGVSVPQSTSFGRDGASELYMIGGTRLWKIVRQ